MRKKTGIMIALLLCLYEALAVYPAENAEWRLENERGDVFYIDGVNLNRTWSDGTVMYYGAEAKVPPGEALLIENGISLGIRKNVAPLNPQQTAVMAKWDALEYLRSHYPAGTTVRCCPVPPFPEFRITFPFDFFNEGRIESNKLWVYTPNYHGDTDNIFRIQAAVSNGRVTALDGGLLPVPADGFLLAGHGTGLAASGSTRILNWCGIGCRVELDIPGKTLTIITDRETWLRRSRHLLEEAKDRIRQNRPKLSPDTLLAAEKYRETAELLHQNAMLQTGQAAWDQLKQATQFAKKSLIHASLSGIGKDFRYIAVSGEIDERLLDVFKTAGFKGIMLHYDDTNRKNIAGLQRTADYATSIGLEVGLWCWLPTRFPVSPETAATLPPDLDRNGKPHFFELENPTTRQAYCRELIRICRQLNIRQVMFDYEAYRGGYGPATASAMLKQFPDLPTDFFRSKLTAAQQQWWLQYQERQVHTMMKETLAELKRNSIPASLCVYPGAQIEDLTSGTIAAPGPGIWLPWLKEFDAVILMMYSQSPRWLEQRSRILFPAIRRAAPKIKIDAWMIYWPELCGHTSPVPLDNLLRQTDVMLRTDIDGLSFFHGANLDTQRMPDFTWLLTAMRYGIYRPDQATGK